jgi:RNA polymerase sigma-70 factor (sigma-E family)
VVVIGEKPDQVDRPGGDQPTSRGPGRNLMLCPTRLLSVGMPGAGASAFHARTFWRSAGEVTSADAEFDEFAEAALLQLRRTAFLLCGDWHTAEDLAQTTLAKVFVSWRKIKRRDVVHAYAKRTLVNAYLDDKRLMRSGEIVTDRFPDCPAEPQALETRLVVQAALATLPPRARAVVVLRYWEDLSVEQVAEMLGCPPGTVKSHTARALQKLRAALGEAMTGYGPAGRPEEPHEAGDSWHG